MRFTPPLKQYLFRWFREKKEASRNVPQLGGIIFLIDESDPTDKLKFIQTSYSGYNTHWWHTHNKDGKARDNWLEEYTPSEKELRHVLKTVFILANEDGTIE